ncbi:biotin transport system substrate-specific component [Aneurinibacillus soli]|uniref:Biotin transporter n=1 Tax=Aneurinibacillus soli TaxID=1500254 RepID=A0A0U4WDQ3_9BACL|nr:biotin transporter BioY [Aneurinibacillus soli]PYE62376.1 biotin transport system substrate-specific component [Aneurinibacillus soli]BAU26939.1 Biotin transporter BioY [Aneurinibacillus soli]
MQSQRLKMMILSALFCAIISVCAQLSISFLPMVPFTMQNFAIALTVIILGQRYGTLAVLLYILLGVIGVPVFAQFKTGASVLVGPTGGYLIGYIVAAFVMGMMLKRDTITVIRAFLANVVGLAIIYALGVAQLKLVAHLTWNKAIAVGMTPFIAPDLLKIALASYVGVLVIRRLKAAGLMPSHSQSKTDHTA